MFFRKKYDSISVSELNDLLKTHINLIDVREAYEYKRGHVKKAKNIAYGVGEVRAWIY